jgi:hypothetical protein
VRPGDDDDAHLDRVLLHDVSLKTIPSSFQRIPNGETAERAACVFDHPDRPVEIETRVRWTTSHSRSSVRSRDVQTSFGIWRRPTTDESNLFKRASVSIH